MVLKKICVSVVSVAGFFLTSAPALARESGASPSAHGAWPGKMQFDLARDCPRPVYLAGDNAEQGVSPSGQAAAPIRNEHGFSSHEQLAPYFVYAAGKRGPTIELAALGAGRKDNPRLAHLALGWNF